MSDDGRKGFDPLATARRLTAPFRPKRFYASVEMREEGGSFVLRLDGKRAMTPGKAPIKVPRRDLAEAIAAEWLAQGEFIDAVSMPVTRLANSTIDAVMVRQADVRTPILDYAGSDLLYYRAGEPEALAARQREQWDPILAWAENCFGGQFVLSEGVVHVTQPDATLKAIAAAIEDFDDPFRLAGLSLATALTGSALIALALAEGAIDRNTAWTAAHVDEDWNIEQWGEDSEAMRRRTLRYSDFRAAALALGNGGEV